MGNNPTSMIIIGLIVVVVLVFIIISSITGKKTRKKEQEKRKRVVKDEIKLYLAKAKNQKNVSVDFEKVFSRKGAEYRYRDVFDVIVRILSPKDGTVLETKAFEIEGVTQKVAKKEFRTEWIVNQESDLDEVQKRIAIAEKKIKLTKEERKEIKKQESQIIRDQKIKENEEISKKKQEIKTVKKDKSTIKMHYEKKKNANKDTKFIPERNK